MKNVTTGFTLIEILISFLLLSIALLGLDILELYTFHTTLNAYYLNLAHAQIENMINRLRTVKATPQLQPHIKEWNTENEELLPQGRGQISGSYPVYQLQLSWGPDSLNVCEANLQHRSGCILQDVRLE